MGFNSAFKGLMWSLHSHPSGTKNFKMASEFLEKFVGCGFYTDIDTVDVYFVHRT